ncbi:MAG: P-II family nitrogen regulator [Mariprofundaceae bacterium]
MSARNIIVLTDVYLITCIVQRSTAETVIQAAQAAGAQGATVHFAHGIGAHELLGVLSVAIDVEKEVINILVASDQADTVFESMYLAGQLDTPGKGAMYMIKLDKAATYVNHEIVERLVAEQ